MRIKSKKLKLYSVNRLFLCKRERWEDILIYCVNIIQMLLPLSEGSKLPAWNQLEKTTPGKGCGLILLSLPTLPSHTSSRSRSFWLTPCLLCYAYPSCFEPAVYSFQYQVWKTKFCSTSPRFTLLGLAAPSAGHRSVHR